MTRYLPHITKLLLLVLVLSLDLGRAQNDPSKFNGGSVLAMAGSKSVAIAVDSRFGLGFQTVHSLGDTDEGNPRIIHLPNSNTLMAWTGLYGDGLSFTEELNVIMGRKFRNDQVLSFPNTKRRITGPKTIAMLMSHLLYQRRNAPYYVEPVVVGLESVPIDEVRIGEAAGELRIEDASSGLQSIIDIARSGQRLLTAKEDGASSQPARPINRKLVQRPYLCTTDMLGAQSTSSSFVASGVASRSLYGTAEALWRPDLSGEELVEVCGRAFLSALERDCLSGYGVVIYLIEGIGDDDARIVEYVLDCRND